MGVKVTLQVRSVTGRVRYYPVGENAKPVLQLTKKKTLSELDVEALKALGCEIERIVEDQSPKKKRWGLCVIGQARGQCQTPNDFRSKPLSIALGKAGKG